MRSLYLLLVLFLTSCASIIDGTSQDITINTNPSEASCKLTRKDETLPSIASTPATIHVEKTKDDITVVCSKLGYLDATSTIHSGAAGATAGNIILGGGIGWAFDSAMGADNKYDSPVTITLTR